MLRRRLQIGEQRVLAGPGFVAAGEVAGEKSIKALAEVIDDLSQDTDITNRFGQKGLGQRNLGAGRDQYDLGFSFGFIQHVAATRDICDLLGRAVLVW